MGYSKRTLVQWCLRPFSLVLNNHIIYNEKSYHPTGILEEFLVHEKRSALTKQFVNLQSYGSDSLLKHVGGTSFFMLSILHNLGGPSQGKPPWPWISSSAAQQYLVNQTKCSRVFGLSPSGNKTLAWDEKHNGFQPCPIDASWSPVLIDPQHLFFFFNSPHVFTALWNTFFSSLLFYQTTVEETLPYPVGSAMEILLILQQTLNFFIPKDLQGMLIRLLDVQSHGLTRRRRVNLATPGYLTCWSYNLWPILLCLLDMESERLNQSLQCESPSPRTLRNWDFFLKHICVDRVLPLCVRFYLTHFNTMSGVDQADFLCKLSPNVTCVEPIEIPESIKHNQSSARKSLQDISHFLLALMHITCRVPISFISLETLTNALYLFQCFKDEQTHFHQQNKAAELSHHTFSPTLVQRTYFSPSTSRISEKTLLNELHDLYKRIVQRMEQETMPLSLLHHTALWLSSFKFYVEKTGYKHITPTHLDNMLFKVYSALVNYPSNQCHFYRQVLDIMSTNVEPDAVEIIFNLWIQRLNDAFLQKSTQSSKRLLESNQKKPFSLKESPKKLRTRWIKPTSSLLPKLKRLNSLAQTSHLSFPLEAFETQRAGAMLSAMLEWQRRRLQQKKKDRFDSRWIYLNKEDQNPLGLCLNVLSNMISHLHRQNGPFDSWLFLAWKESILLQGTLAQLLFCEGIFPKYPSTNLKNKSFSWTQPLPLAESKKNCKIPAAFIYYNAKRLQLNIEQCFLPATSPYSGIYSSEIIPLHIQNDIQKLDALTFMLTKRFQTSSNQNHELQQHIEAQLLPSKAIQYFPPTKNFTTPLDVIFLHGLRGSGLKTWRWIHDEPYIDLFFPQPSLPEAGNTREMYLNCFNCGTRPNHHQDQAKKKSEKRTTRDVQWRKSSYTMDISEPNESNTWYFHWPQLFLPHYLPQSSRVLALNLSIPLFQRHNLSGLLSHIFTRPHDENFSKQLEHYKKSLLHLHHVVFHKSTLFFHSKERRVFPWGSPGLRQLTKIQQINPNLMHNQTTLAQLAKVVKSHLEQAKVIESPSCVEGYEPNNTSRRIIWITHSMGGLFLKWLLLDDSRLASRTVGIVFMGVPHFGSPLSKEFEYFDLLLPEYCRQLHPHRYKDVLHDLNEEFRQLCLRNNISIISFAENLATPLPYISQIFPKYKRLIVPSQFANPQYGRFFLIPQLDHTELCRIAAPDDRLLLLIQLIRKASQK